MLYPALTQDVQDVALTLMEGLSCPRSLTVAILLRYGDLGQIVSLKTDPSHYPCSETFFNATAATSFFAKYDHGGRDDVSEVAAIKKWWWAEHECYKTNERLAPYLDISSVDLTQPEDVEQAIRSFLDSVRKNASFLLGSRPPELLDGAFGPGATMSDKSQASTVPDKMSSLPSFTSNALFHLVPWTGTAWAKASATLERTPVNIRGNAYFSVYKNALTRRGCAKEPSINGFFQLGVGRVMKRRLLARGLDLAEGQDTHRLIAQKASVSGDFATIDLSSASDTVCTNLVKLVLPHKWLDLLESLRSPNTLIEGKWVRLEKFSSMGNGFTFELETAIFASIAKSACNNEVTFGKDLFVYGDDIIVPTRFAKDVVSALKFFGFTPNEKKTFVEGSFRESCGGDYYNGVGVRPFSLPEDPNEPQKLISLANGIRRMACQDGSHPNRWRDLKRSWFKCLDLLPKHIRCLRGPSGLGDIVIHDAEDYWETRWRNSIRYVRCYRPSQYRVIGWEGFAYDVQFAAALYGVALTPKSVTSGRSITAYAARIDPTLDPRGVIPRDGVTGYKVGWVTYS